VSNPQKIFSRISAVLANSIALGFAIVIGCFSIGYTAPSRPIRSVKAFERAQIRVMRVSWSILDQYILDLRGNGYFKDLIFLLRILWPTFGSYSRSSFAFSAFSLTFHELSANSSCVANARNVQSFSCDHHQQSTVS
jgi:hypothetical protein